MDGLTGEAISYRVPSAEENGSRIWSAGAPRWCRVGQNLASSMTSRGPEGAFPVLSRMRRCRAVVDLAAVFLPDVAVAYWPRRIDPGLDTYLEAVLATGGLGAGARWVIDVDGPHEFPELPGLPNKNTLCDDVAFLGRLCADLVGCSRLGVRIEVLDRAMCPRFHVDRVGLRLLCTYLGPGTEYLDASTPTSSDPSAVAPVTARATDQGERIVRFPRGAVVLLKGDAWPGNEGRGAVHRSPAVRGNDAKRVLLAIDPLE
jgi:hypothetical protein